MSVRNPLFLLLLVSLPFFLDSCRSRRLKKKTTTEKAPQADSLDKCRLPLKSSKALSSLMKKHEFSFTTLSGKFDANLTVDGKKNEFSVAFRMQKDSVIWMSIIDPLIGAVEAARLLLTRDSIKMMDRINNRAFIGSYDTISSLLNTEIDFELLQSILIGNSVEFYEEESKLKPGVDRGHCLYMLGTIRKRKGREVMDGHKEPRDPVQSIWIRDGSFKISRIYFTDQETSRTFDAHYDKFEKVDSLLFPFQSVFFAKANANIEMRFSYKRVNSGKEQSFPFNIPSGYEIIRKKVPNGK